MKPISLLICLLALYGCASKSAYDITPEQAKKHLVIGGPGDGHRGSGFDENHLPPGAVRHETIYHKGDKLPDGTISPGTRKLVTVEINGTPPK